jgi:hypothetical protein
MPRDWPRKWEVWHYAGDTLKHVAATYSDALNWAQASPVIPRSARKTHRKFFEEDPYN